MQQHEQYDGDDMSNIDLRLAAMEHGETRGGRHQFIESMLDDHAMLAKAFYSAYSSLVEEGFDEAQALHLITARGWDLGECDRG